MMSTPAKINTQKEWVVAIFVVICSILLKISLFPTNNHWHADLGRDMLAGHLISSQHIKLNQGHFNSGINNFYPSFYYYFIALLTWVTGGEYLQIVTLLALYQGIGALLFFAILRKYFPFLPTLVATVLYSFSQLGINFVLLPISAHNSVPIVLLSFFLLGNGVEKNQIGYLFFSALFLAFAATFFYGSLLLLPFFLVIFFLLQQQKNKESHQKTIKQIVFYLFAFFTFFSLFFGKSDDIPHRQQLFASTIEKIKNIGDISTEIRLESYHSFIEIYPRLTFLAVLLYTIYTIKNIINKKSRPYIILFIIMFFIHEFLYAIHKNPLGHYVLYVWIIIVAMMAHILTESYKKNGILFIALSIFFLYSANAFAYNKYQVNDESYDHHKKVSEIIAQSFPGKSIINWRNCKSESYWNKKFSYGKEVYDSRTYWYFQKENTRLFILNDKHSQIALAHDAVVYLCFLREDELTKKETINPIINNKPILTFNLDQKVYFVYDK